MGRLYSDDGLLSPHTAARDVHDGTTSIAQRIEDADAALQTALVHTLHQSMRGLNVIADILNKGVFSWLTSK